MHLGAGVAGGVVEALDVATLVLGGEVVSMENSVNSVGRPNFIPWLQLQRYTSAPPWDSEVEMHTPTTRPSGCGSLEAQQS